jgi:primosomal protein N' (replication factor Y) (superfamily II helicase)
MSSRSPFRLEIAPLTPLFGRSDPLFSYASPEPIPVGSVVSIPFGRRQLLGVVMHSAPMRVRRPPWMKEVVSVKFPHWLAPEQLRFAETLATDCFAPLGLVLKHFVPLTRPPKKSVSRAFPVPRHRRPRKKRAEQTTMLAYPSEAALTEAVVQRLAAEVQPGNQALFLVPETLAAEAWATRLRDTLPTLRIASLTSRATASEILQVFIAARSGEADIVVGTRQALFLPWQHLVSITVLDPENRVSYVQWEMTPHYDTVRAAASLADIHGATLATVTTAPGIAFFASHQNRRGGNGASIAIERPGTLDIVDLRLRDARPKKTDALSPVARRHIETTDKKGVGMLILTAQRGLSRFSLCARCRRLFRCPRCASTLGEKEGGTYRCRSCRYVSPLFPSCPTCGHGHFEAFGAGTEQVARELRRLHLKLPVTVIDSDTLSTKKGFQGAVRAIADPVPKIWVATYDAARNLPLPPLGLVVMIEPDNGLSYPDYQASERLWVEERRFASKLSSSGTLCVQTFEGEARQWKLWPMESPETTAETLLAERRVLRYPPVTSLWLLVCPGSRRESSREQAARLANALRETLKDIASSDVSPPFFPSHANKKTARVLVRLPAQSPLPDRARALLIAAAREVHIHTNPWSLNL